MRNSVSLGALRLFLRVAATSSFSESARLERVSQPALSRTIRLLEEQLGVRLFDRTTRNVALTAAGGQLQPIAERLIGDYDLAFSDLAQTLSGERGRVPIGALPSVAAAMLPPVLARFRRERPQVDVRVIDDLSAPLVHMLDERRIDFAVTIDPEPAGRWDFLPLMSDDFVLVCRRGHALDSAEPLRWSGLAGADFIAMAPGSSVRHATDKAFGEGGVVVRPLYECGHLATVGGFIRAGLGVSALPRSAVPLLGEGLATRPLRRPHARRSIGVLTLKSRTTAAPAEALIKLLRLASTAELLKS